jgi:hypothetical protein
VFASYLAFNLDNLRGMLRRNVLENISAGAFVRFRSFRAGMMQLVSKHIQQLSLVLGHRCSLVVTQWEAVNNSILAKAGVSVKRKKVYEFTYADFHTSRAVTKAQASCKAS